MFASVYSRLPARLRRALAYIKAFALLEDPPRAVVPYVSIATPAGLSSACAGDRRRGPVAPPGGRPVVVDERCGSTHSPAGRSGRPAAPAQRCATPTTSGKRAYAPLIPGDRRAAVPGGFLHR
jgi:hypothetical protein